MTVTDDDLHAFLDGELPPERAARIEVWLADHPEDADRLRLYAEHNAGLHRLFDPVLEEPVPARLTAAAIRRKRSPARWAVRIAASLALVALGAGGGWWLRGAAPVAPVGVAHEALSAHLVFASEIRHPVEVPASEQPHLVAWLSKRLGAPLAVPNLEAAGFHLVGGRLLPAATGPAAQFMYENATGQRVTLYLNRNPAGSTTAFRLASAEGAHAFYWLDGPLGYALVGGGGRDELMGLAKAVYHQVDGK